MGRLQGSLTNGPYHEVYRSQRFHPAGKQLQHCRQPHTEVLAMNAVLITPPPIPTRLRESSRIPTGFLLDFNKISKKAFSHIFSFPFLLDSHGTPSGLQLNLYQVNAMDSYWIPTGLLLDSSPLCVT